MQQQQKEKPIVLIAFGVFLLLGFWSISNLGNNPQEAPPVKTTTASSSIRSVDPEYGNKIEVQTCSQLYVERMLKSPRSAKHPWALADDIVTKTSDSKYHVRSYVDAENVYGAMLRAYYTCDVELSSSALCSSINCYFDE